MDYKVFEAQAWKILAKSKIEIAHLKEKNKPIALKNAMGRINRMDAINI